MAKHLLHPPSSPFDKRERRPKKTDGPMTAELKISKMRGLESLRKKLEQPRSID